MDRLDCCSLQFANAEAATSNRDMSNGCVTVTTSFFRVHA